MFHKAQDNDFKELFLSFPQRHNIEFLALVPELIGNICDLLSVEDNRPHSGMDREALIIV